MTQRLATVAPISVIERIIIKPAMASKLSLIQKYAASM